MVTRSIEKKRARAREKPMALYKSALILLAAPVALAHCANGGRQPPRGPETETEPFMVPASRVEAPGEASRTRAPVLSDGQIGMASDVAHTAAIDQSRIAFAKASDPRVRDFAKKMLAEHGKAKQEEQAILVRARSSPEESPLSTELGVDAGRALFALREADGAMLDRAYVDGQLALHERYLKALDEQLIPSARDSELEEALRNSRRRVKAHLDELRQIERTLDDSTKSSIPAGPAPL
jgi:putative membrane protein